jgi:hypothetical protein
MCYRFEDIACLGDSHTLSEISLDGNPFSQDPHYKQTVLRFMQQIRQFDMKRVSVRTSMQIELSAFAIIAHPRVVVHARLFSVL